MRLATNLTPHKINKATKHTPPTTATTQRILVSYTYTAVICGAGGRTRSNDDSSIVVRCLTIRRAASIRSQGRRRCTRRGRFGAAGVGEDGVGGLAAGSFTGCSNGTSEVLCTLATRIEPICRVYRVRVRASIVPHRRLRAHPQLGCQRCESQPPHLLRARTAQKCVKFGFPEYFPGLRRTWPPKQLVPDYQSGRRPQWPKLM
eukprot:818669-Prymnesium_polylepis.1